MRVGLNRVFAFDRIGMTALHWRSARHGRPFDERGASAVEFAIVAPLMITMMVGSFQFGLTIYDYLSLADATSIGARTLAMSRGTSTPESSTVAAMQSAAPNLTQANLNITLALAGTACATDAACTTALLAGETAKITATYPCNLTVLGVNYFPGCVLTATTTARVE